MPKPYSLDLRERVVRFVSMKVILATRPRRISGCRFPLSSTW